MCHAKTVEKKIFDSRYKPKKRLFGAAFYLYYNFFHKTMQRRNFTDVRHLCCLSLRVISTHVRYMYLNSTFNVFSISMELIWIFLF